MDSPPRMLSLLILTALIAAAAAAINTTADAADLQLATYKENHKYPAILTTSSGCPAEFRHVNKTLNTNLLTNAYFVDTMTHLLSERIPLRFLHVKGMAAFGYFEVTDDVTDLTKASFLSTIGKKTRIAVRFSPALQRQGASDLSFSIRVHGFAVKFYTDEGNFDIPGFTAPVFVTRDPAIINTFFHSLSANPVTNLPDQNMTWDFIINNPSAFFAIFRAFSASGLPQSYRYVPGFSVHTMQLANNQSETSFSRIYFTPDLGVKNLTEGSTTDESYLTRDLYNAIANGDYPSWTVWLQPLTTEAVKNASSNGEDVFDVTRELSTDVYPLRKVGKFVLNENPKNYFADVEQMAFNPGNVVPGIVGAPDKIYEFRSLGYRLTEMNRLGVNFNKIPVNRPLSNVSTYTRDGVPPTNDNDGDGPSYFPNSFNGATPLFDHQPDLVQIKEEIRSNFDQVASFYINLSEADKIIIIDNLSKTFVGLTDEMHENAMNFLAEIDQDIADRIEAVL